MRIPIANLLNDVQHYLRFYRDYAGDRWDEMTPMQYGCLLIGIGLAGWIMMKNAVR